MSLIITLIILVALSAYFSATETAFSTLNRIRIKNLAATNKRAALTLSLYEDYDRILSTILIGNNIVNISLRLDSHDSIHKIFSGKRRNDLDGGHDRSRSDIRRNIP